MAATNVVGYVRVSTAEQVSGYGLNVQERMIRDHCKSHGLRLVALCTDAGQSGSNGLSSRQGLAEALALIKSGAASQLLVPRLDRLARDLIVQETVIAELHHAGAAVVSVTEPDVDSEEPTRKLVRQVLGAISEYERAVIRGRMMAGKAAKREQGGYGGGTLPYGFRLEEGQVVPDPDEQKVVAFVGRRHLQGASLRTICAELTQAGYRPRVGSTWHPTTVARIVRYTPKPAGSPAYSGATAAS